jgi:hypothetical protein
MIIINNNYERSKDLILFLKIPMGMRKDFFFEIYGQFRHAPSKRFSAPGIDCGHISYWLRIRQIVDYRLS